METKGISQVIKTLGETFSRNSPTILTAMSVAGLVSTVFLAVRATPKALSLLESERERLYYDEVDGQIDFTKMKTIKIAWTAYIPAVAVGAATVACIIGANHISLRRNAALASLYSLTEVAFKEYQTKVVDTIGRNKELKVRDEIAGDKLRRHPFNEDDVILTSKGNVLCLDAMSGQTFRSDIEKIRQSVNYLNNELLHSDFVSLNDFYYELGIRNVKRGGDMGWDVNQDMIELTFSSQLSENSEPCLVLDYEVVPRYM